MPKIELEFFYPPSVSARCDYGAGRIRWRHIANVNEIIEIISLVSMSQKGFKLAQCMAASGGIKRVDKTKLATRQFLSVL